MPATRNRDLLNALLDSWDRNNTVLLNLLRALGPGGLQARAMEGSPSVAEMFTHMHHERLASVLENAPEHAAPMPERQWVDERDTGRIEQMLTESAGIVRAAVEARTESGRALDLDYDHPVQLLQFLIFHEGYHHGQIKLALKAADRAIPDDVAGPPTWRVWRSRSTGSSAASPP